MSSDVVLRVDRADRQAGEPRLFKGTGITATTTGSGRLFSTLDHYLVESQISSFGTAFFTVFAVIFIVFRSARFGLLTIAPNLFPVLAVLGVMGFLGISMNIATVMVASVALGVVDDDTIHFINRYRREVAAGATTDAAIETATVHEGRASLTTAIDQQPRVRRPADVRVQADRVVRRPARPDDGGGVPRGGVHPAGDDQADARARSARTRFGAAAARVRRGPRAAGRGRPCRPRRRRVPTGNVSVLRGSPAEPRGDGDAGARCSRKRSSTPARTCDSSHPGFVEGLVADRGGQVNDAIVEPRSCSSSSERERGSALAVGMGRVVWGRLDELQPTDVVNPLDVSRFFFEGRSEARLSVPLIRATIHAGEKASIDGIYVPWFRRGRFDRLDEPTSPFNIAPLIPFVDERPARTAANGQGGVARQRHERTSGLVGVGLPRVPAVRGVFGVRARSNWSAIYPRFTMIGGDFETVSGAWAIRGEVGGLRA